MTNRRRLFSALAIGMALSLTVVDAADAARRGGGFGSRGSRTFQVPRSTSTAPAAARPIDRTMTPRTPMTSPARPGAAQTAQQPRRGGFLGGLGGGLLGGLLLGGLFGMMMGHGFGGMGGMLALLLQVALVALVATFALRMFRRRREPAYAAGPARREFEPVRPVDPQPYRGGAAGLSAPANAGHDEVGIGDKDFDEFERLLREVQTAYGAEDYGALRERTTPEVMGYLAEELATNVKQGRRNEITAVKLLQGDLSESWREDDTDFATVAMRYESLDVVRDYRSGQVIEGDAERPVETTEVWTFRREGGPWGGGWKLAAVQEV